MTSLPTLRRKIFQSFSIMILLYGVLGLVLVTSVFTTSKTTPKILHVNYDSISWAYQMKQAWNALWNYPNSSDVPRTFWIDKFDSALKLEERNITEPGEGSNTKAIRELWNKNYGRSQTPSKTDLLRMDELLSEIIRVNENGMFQLAQSNMRTGNYVLVGTIIYFLVSLILSFLLADGLSSRLSTPIKNIVEALHRRPEIGRKLKLISPNSLELLILTTELNRLWNKVIESEQTNVRELIEQKNKLEIVLESVEDALLVVDPHGKVSHANQCMQNFIGLQPSQVIGQKWEDLPTLNENYIMLRSCLGSDMDDSKKIELPMNGIQRQFAARHRRIFGTAGQHSGILYLLHDITDKLQKQRFREDFIDLLSHEIKTPLQSLGSAAELLLSKRDELPEFALNLADIIREDVERIHGVANEFVQVTQSPSKIMKLRLERVSMNNLLCEWIKPFRIVAKDRSVKLNLLCEGSETIWSNLDTAKFPWVISNFLSNAIRFSPEGGEVLVCLTDRNGAVEIQVKDEGPGISELDQKRIFEPFFQSSATTPSGKQGLFGVGLTIAKEVVEAHEGRIEYYKRLPLGSEFRIILPYPA